MTRKFTLAQIRCVVLCSGAALIASVAISQGLRPPPDFPMPMGTKPQYLPKLFSGIQPGQVNMGRIASYGAAPLMFPYSVKLSRDDIYAKLQKEGFTLITLPPPGPGAPPIVYVERVKNGVYQKVSAGGGRRRGGGDGGTTALLTEGVARGYSVPKSWPAVSVIPFRKHTIGKEIPGNLLKGRVPDRMVIITGTWKEPTRWDAMYALPNEFSDVWRDLDSSTPKDWTKKARRTYGELRNTSYQTVSSIDVQVGPPMRSDGLKAKTFVVVHYIKR